MAEVKKRKTSVYWKDEDLILVIPKVVDYITNNPSLKLGEAFVMAQRFMLGDDRQKNEHDLRYHAEEKYGKLVEREISRRERAAAKEEKAHKAAVETVVEKKTPTSKATLRGPMVAMQPVTAAPVDQMTQMIADPAQFADTELSTAQSMGSLVTRLITSVGDCYEQALYEELKSRGRRALLRVASEEASAMKQAGMRHMQTVPSYGPTPAPAPPQVQALNLEDKEGKSVQVLGKPKVALVGNMQEDWKYFSRIRDGLDGQYEFIEIGKLKDAPKAATCHLIVYGGSTDSRTLNAVKAIVGDTSQIWNKPAHVVNAQLINYFREWRDKKQSAVSQ